MTRSPVPDANSPTSALARKSRFSEGMSAPTRPGQLVHRQRSAGERVGQPQPGYRSNSGAQLIALYQLPYALTEGPPYGEGEMRVVVLS